MSIVGQGLEEYYRLRDVSPGVGEPKGVPVNPELTLYDDPAIQLRFVRKTGSAGNLEAQLLIEGIRCAACVWLVEQTLERCPGVTSVEVNYATHRAVIGWNPELVRLSAVLGAVRRVGYAASPFEEGRLALLERGERRKALWRVAVAGLGMMQVMMYAIPSYIADEGSITADIDQLMRWASLILTLPVVLYSAAPFFIGAARDIRILRLGMDVPVALGILVAFSASAWATVSGKGEVYFDSVTMFVFLLLGGRFLELLARQRAGMALQYLGRLLPEVAHRIKDPENQDTDTIPAASLLKGDRVLVLPGEALPADGILEGTSATVSEALLTGESRPLLKLQGSLLLGGGINHGSAIVMRVTRVGGETAFSSIVRLMERSMMERPRWAELSQRAASWFVGSILLVSLGAWFFWLPTDPGRALWIAISVLVVTCPCALSLAIPVALTVATGELARRNVIATRSHVVEILAAATDVVLDKTGTLTTGRMDLAETHTLGERSADDCKLIAAALECVSEHPIARAFVVEGDSRQLPVVESLTVAPGDGVEGIVKGIRYRIGRAEFAGNLHGQPVPAVFPDSKDSIVWLADGTGWLAAFRLGDTVRADSADAVAQFQSMGKRVHLLSGDNAAVAGTLASAVGISTAVGSASPVEKLSYVKALQSGGAVVVMVGDGINDAPVLAQADVSMAMGGGADLAQVQADAVLLSDSLGDLASAMLVAKTAHRVIRENLVWALGYNLVAVPLAVAGWVTPWIAGIGMSASSLAVVLNALRIRGSRPDTLRTDMPERS